MTAEHRHVPLCAPQPASARLRALVERHVAEMNEQAARHDAEIDALVEDLRRAGEFEAADFTRRFAR